MRKKRCPGRPRELYIVEHYYRTRNDKNSPHKGYINEYSSLITSSHRKKFYKLMVK